jgi:hypothetical protein
VIVVIATDVQFHRMVNDRVGLTKRYCESYLSLSKANLFLFTKNKHLVSKFSSLQLFCYHQAMSLVNLKFKI